MSRDLRPENERSSADHSIAVSKVKLQNDQQQLLVRAMERTRLDPVLIGWLTLVCVKFMQMKAFGSAQLTEKR